MGILWLQCYTVLSACILFCCILFCYFYITSGFTYNISVVNIRLHIGLDNNFQTKHVSKFAIAI